jgi:hypothetical protein
VSSNVTDAGGAACEGELNSATNGVFSPFRGRLGPKLTYLANPSAKVVPCGRPQPLAAEVEMGMHIDQAWHDEATSMVLDNGIRDLTDLARRAHGA